MATKILSRPLLSSIVRYAKPTSRAIVLTRRSFSSAADARLRRSVHFVPGDNIKFLSKSLTLGADTLVLDLEDSVKDKALGRSTVHEFLATLPPDNSRGEVLVRINPLSGSYWQDDIQSSLHADGFMVPKVESREELIMLDEYLSSLEQKDMKPKVVFPIATETPAAVLNIADIAKGPRVCAITWGCEDLSAELGSYGTRNSSGYLDIFSHCRNMCLLAAKAADVQAIDGIYQNVRDMTGFEQEGNEAKYMGFDGKLTLHPNQISALHRIFEPTEAEMKDANTIVKLWEDGDGKGAVLYEGKMIDMPHYMRAKKIMARSSSGGNTQSGAAAGKVVGKKNDTIPQPKQSHAVAAGNDEVFPRVCMGKYYDELTPGLTIRHYLTRTVTESDNVFFTCLTMNPAPIHLDHELSKGNAAALSGSGAKSNAGKPLFNSMFTLALLVGMSVPEATHGTTVANLGFSEVLFPKPVYPGDTLRAETVVVDRRESKSRPTQGIVTLQHLAYNQRGEVVCKATRQALMKKSLGQEGDTKL
ncbi:hypothetical protein ACHAXN_002684 [Cyclotella atomus]